MRSKLTPCIQPVSSAENATENTALLPVSMKTPKALNAPQPKNRAAQVMGFLIYLRYNPADSQKLPMLNTGKITPVKIDTALES